MEQTINALNFEIGVFRRNLRTFLEGDDVCIGHKTIAVLAEVKKCIDELLIKANLKTISNESDAEFLNELDEQFYELRRTIVCRPCIETLPFSKEDFDAHQRKVSHNVRIRGTNVPSRVQNMISQQSSKSTIPSPPLLKVNGTEAASFVSQSNCVRSEPVKKPSLKINDTTAIFRKRGLNVDKPFRSSITKLKPDYDCTAELKTVESEYKIDINTFDDLFDASALGIGMTLPKKSNENTTEGGNCDRQQREQHQMIQQEPSQKEHQKNHSTEHVLDPVWKGVRVIESSCSDSSDSSSHGFNYDSLYLIELRGLPWSVTRTDIKQFLSDVTILNNEKGIHFIIDDKIRKVGRAFVQLAQIQDIRNVKKYHKQKLNDHCIEVTTGDNPYFRQLVSQRKIPSKDRVVFLDGLSRSGTEHDVREFFNGLKITRILLANDYATSKYGAFAKFSLMDEVEQAIKRNDKNQQYCVYRSSEEQLRLCYKNGNKYPSAHSSLSEETNRTNDQGNKRYRSGNYMKIWGLPWTIDKEFVYNMFPGLEIDPKDDIEMQRDFKKRNNGTAFVKFKNQTDFELALRIDTKEFGQYVKLCESTEVEFLMTKKDNEQSL